MTSKIMEDMLNKVRKRVFAEAAENSNKEFHLHVAKQLLTLNKHNISLEEIAEISKVSLDEVKQLAAELKK